MVAVAVDEGKVRLDVQTVDGKLHRLHAGVQNVDLVDLPRVHGRDAVSDRPFADDVKQRLALFLAELLRVVQPLDDAALRQDHRGGVHRAHQRTRARLVHAADMGMPLCAGGGFQLIACERNVLAHAFSSGNSSVKRPSLPARYSSSKMRAMRSVFTSPPDMRKPRLRPAFSSSSQPGSPGSTAIL